MQEPVSRKGCLGRRKHVNDLLDDKFLEALLQSVIDFKVTS